MTDHIPDTGKMVSTPESVIDRVLFEQGYDRTEGTSRAILSALSAAGLVVEQGWQPIETAPRDGTRMLCYAPAVEGRASLVRSDFWWLRVRAFAHMRPIQPYTHWRHLPTPPGDDT